MPLARVVGAMAILLSVLSSVAPAAGEAYRGLGLITPYPDQTLPTGTGHLIPLTVANYGLPPQWVEVRVTQAPAGWTVALQAAGRPVGAVLVEPDQNQALSLWVEPQEGAAGGPFPLLLEARSSSARARLPLRLHLSEQAPQPLALEVGLPVLRGTARTVFTFELTAQNPTERDVMAALNARAPDGFRVDFLPRFSEQEITGLPVKAGDSAQIDVRVAAPRGTPAGTYPITVTALAGTMSASEALTLEITGEPRLKMAPPDERLSGTAYLGVETPLQLQIENMGTAPAEDLRLTGFAPANWSLRLEPAQIDRLAPGEHAMVTAVFKPGEKSLAGDYLLTLEAHGRGTEATLEYRVTALTSTLWGLVGIALAAVALLMVDLVVARHGRR